ncbi:uncharacterized protein N7483_010134 [Penicillium malachiteum]|uniref:uncharacterized protein n=1 Tax=Penicillium malachiteum TaxID=1324776 RepID=UPI00254681C3|nr:uncharacterized protein N7483_010134 [Penicillium malachiteum]KAJ5712953.1 hypothetical protein N7483_010134 [Penicillium malachiteum]
MSSAAQSVQCQDDNRKERMGPPAVKRRRIIDTILSESDGTIEDHRLCDHLISTYSETNKKLRSKLKDTQVKLSGVESDFDDLEARHSQCPYWIQKNESLVEALEDRCETLERDKKTLQERCEWLYAQLQNLQLLSPREHHNVTEMI